MIFWPMLVLGPVLTGFMAAAITSTSVSVWVEIVAWLLFLPVGWWLAWFISTIGAFTYAHVRVGYRFDMERARIDLRHEAQRQSIRQALSEQRAA
jgi:hypothetical protein